jgi:hypothetical protein
MDIPERVNDGYSNKDIRTVDFLVSIVIFYLKKYSNKIIISAHKITGYEPGATLESASHKEPERFQSINQLRWPTKIVRLQSLLTSL